MRTGLRLLAVAGVLLASAAARAGVVVVVSAKSPVASLSAEQVSQIYLGKASRFPDGSDAVALDQPDGSPVRDDFYAKVIGKDRIQVKAYWSKQIFIGKGTPPRELSGNAEVRRQVAAHPSQIGYIDQSAVDRSVRVVLTP